MPHRTKGSRRRPAGGHGLQRLPGPPDLARVVPRLAPEALHRVIRRAGLEGSLDLVEAATGEQLAAVLDLDLWDAPQPGRDDAFDADRFCEWLEALVDRDAASAARFVARLDPSLVVMGLSRFVRVLDPGVLEPTAPSDDEPGEGVIFVPDGLTAQVGGYLVQARREDGWDAIVSLLVELAAEDVECFHEVLRGCRRQSDGEREQDGLDDLLDAGEQILHEVAVGRDDRRTGRGFSTSADARAFLALARRPRTSGRAAGPAPLDAWVGGTLAETGGLQRLMEYLLERHPDVCLARGEELAFLANTLVAGCPLLSRPFTPRHAAEAVQATCALGLLRQPLPPGIDYLVEHDLVGVFADGWAALHREVSLFVAERLRATLRRVRADDADTLDGLRALRRSLDTHLAAGTPWRAQDDLDVLAGLDTLAWHGLLGLMGECPVIPEAVTAIVERRAGRVDPDAFAFIATNADIEAVRAFMARLPGLLAG